MSEDLATKALLEFLNACEAGIAAAKQRIKEAKLPEPSKRDPSKIPWRKAEGSRGSYERYPAKDEKAETLPDYLALLSDLKAHGNKLTRNDFFIWLFDDLATIGRKPKK